jgi:hypothetical protein
MPRIVARIIEKNASAVTRFHGLVTVSQNYKSKKASVVTSADITIGV